MLLYVPAGAAVDKILNQLSNALEPGDVIADGGNSYSGDSIRRHQRLRERKLHFVDVGTSGGLPARATAPASWSAASPRRSHAWSRS